jgi:uracil-DNA glycosylase
VQSSEDNIETKNGQGGSLTEVSRLQYLQAMGIQPWFSKFQKAIEVKEELPATEVNPVSQGAFSTDVAKAEIEVESADIMPTTDVISMDWSQLKQAVSQCQLCELHTVRTQEVYGTGNTDADIFIIGEAPGEDEELKGEPFVGRVESLLDGMLKAIGLNRQQVFMTNVIKCRTPEDRNPHTSETVCCDVYLQRQIALVQPKIILALGRIAAHHLLLSQESLGVLRRQVHSYNGIPLVVSYHPAYLIRKPVEKRKSWEDLLKVKNSL